MKSPKHIEISKMKREKRKDNNMSGMHVLRPVVVYRMKDKPAWNP